MCIIASIIKAVTRYYVCIFNLTLNRQVKIFPKPTYFKKFFYSVFTKSSINVQDSLANSSSTEHNFLEEYSISEKEVYNVLTTIGYDGPEYLLTIYINFCITCSPRAYNTATYPQKGQPISLFLCSNLVKEIS